MRQKINTSKFPFVILLDEANLSPMEYYSDLSYEFSIDGVDLSKIEGVYVYVNDCYESCSYTNGIIRFPGRGGSDRRIFMDCYGFVEITLNIQLNDGTIRNYRYHMKNMSNYFDAEKPFDEVTKRDIEAMVVAMRKAGLAHNTIATYNRMLKTLPM